MYRETSEQEAAPVECRAELELKNRLLAIRKRKLATGNRTPAIEAVRQRLLEERREERDC
jgi:hypothetical protein